MHVQDPITAYAGPHYCMCRTPVLYVQDPSTTQSKRSVAFVTIENHGSPQRLQSLVYTWQPLSNQIPPSVTIETMAAHKGCPCLHLAFTL